MLQMIRYLITYQKLNNFVYEIDNFVEDRSIEIII